MKARRTKDDLVLLHKVEETDDVSFHSSVTKVLKRSPYPWSAYAFSFFTTPPQKYINPWFYKKDIDYLLAAYEVAAQELFRFYIPGQPKTRLIEPTAKQITPEKCYGVLSKGVHGYRALSSIDSDELTEKVVSGEYWGLGEVLVIALLVQETDLKLDNNCLNEHNQIIKLDGDYCFNNLSRKNKLNGKITAKDVGLLPKIDAFEAYNWLDSVTYLKETNEIMIEDKTAFSDAVASVKTVRDEVNKALLKVIVSPYQAIRQLVSSIIDDKDDAKLLYDEVLKRKKMLRNAALRNDSFREYVLSDQAKKDFHDFREYLLAFKITGKKKLDIPEEGRYMERGFTEMLNQIAEEEGNKRGMRM